MLNIKIEKAKGKGWFLKIGNHVIALTSLEIWSLRRVLESTENVVYEEIESELNPDGHDGYYPREHA